MTPKRTWYHIILWITVYLCWIIVFQKRAFAFSKTMTVQFCYLVFVAANYYFNIYVAIPAFLYKKKYAIFALLFLSAIVTTALLRVPLAMYLSSHYFSPGKPAPGFTELFLNSLINIFIWVICLVAGKVIIDRLRFQQYIDHIEKEKTKNELEFLKAQFNPHFLFNSINSIYAHIDKSNSTARSMLLTFSEMLRYQLYECNAGRIGIDKEIGYIKNYIALQQTRNNDNLVIQLHIDENLKGFTIAPLIFIAFIENAFKYVSHYEHRPNQVNIFLQRINDDLVFKVYNTREPHNNNGVIHHKGIGLMNVKRRLELLYPGKHQLTIHANDTSHEVILNLQLS